MKNLRQFASSVVAKRLPTSMPPPVRIVDPEQQEPALPQGGLPVSGAAGGVPGNIVASQAPLQTKPQRIPSLKAGVKLTDDQEQFLSFIEKNKGVGISASPVGSGKTLSMLAATLNLRAKGKAGKAIVLVPAGLRTNFETEGKRFTNAKLGVIGTKDEIASNPKMDVTKMGDKDFYVVSYDMFKQNPKAYLAATGADTVIADEMHRAKDPSTELARTIREIRPHIKNFVGATATPAMNDPFEAVSLINAISQKKMSPAQFQKEFYERKADGFMDWLFGLFGHEKHGPIEGFKNQKALGRFVGAAYHFSEPELKDVPKKKVDVVKVPMTREQTNMYKAILNKQLTAVERNILEKSEMVPEKVLQRIVNKTMAARQLSNNVGYPLGEINVEKTPKALSMIIDASKELKQNPKAQIIMYSNFIDNGTNVLESALQKSRIPYARFTGRDPKTVREKAVADYNDGKVKVIVISGAGSEGLNLPNTTLIQMGEGNYNPEKITQTEGRGIRRGGLSYLPPEKRVVRVKRYVAVPDDDSMSVDEKIYDIAAKKAAFINQFRDVVMKWQKQQKKGKQ